MSDVTAEEREIAHDLARGVYRCNDPHMNKQHSDHCDAIATALATVRKEARREGLKQAWAKVEEMMMAAKTGEKFLQSKRIAAAIRALMEPT